MPDISRSDARAQVRGGSTAHLGRSRVALGSENCDWNVARDTQRLLRSEHKDLAKGSDDFQGTLVRSECVYSPHFVAWVQACKESGAISD